MLLPVLALVEPCQPGSQDNLRSKSRFDKASEDGAVAYLRCDDFIDGQQGALSKIGLTGVGIGIDGSCAGSFAVEISSVVIAAAINDLCGKSGEQCLCPFRAVDHVELALRLCADDALFQVVVVSKR